MDTRRGVWLATFTLNGDRYYYATDDAGNLVAGRSVPLGADPTEATDALWDILDGKAAIPHGASDLPLLRLIS